MSCSTVMFALLLLPRLEVSIIQVLTTSCMTVCNTMSKCAIQGVIWLEDELIGHARLAIEYFRKHRIGVAFVSNNATA